jgi:NAD+ synthase
MNNLIIKTDDVKSRLITFIRDELSKAGFSHAVIGVSGGVDSALSCFLTAEAIGGQNVLALRMPYRTSSQESLDYAQLVIEATGVHSKTLPISEIVDPLINRFQDMDRVRSGNIMARVRMVILYDQSAAFNGLVIGTGNKTEWLLGYTTLYGDSACAFNPIGDLYKSQVRQLAHSMGIPDVIIDKPPTADLWEGQTDEEELGFSYEEVDNLLFLLIDKRYNLQECIEAGFSEYFVRTVSGRVLRNQFKRMLPPVAKVSHLKNDTDFEFLRDFAGD